MAVSRTQLKRAAQTLVPESRLYSLLKNTRNLKAIIQEIFIVCVFVVIVGALRPGSALYES